MAEVIQNEEERKVKIVSTDTFKDEYDLPSGYDVQVTKGQWVDIGTVLATPAEAMKAGEENLPEKQPIIARFSGEVNVTKKKLTISYAEREEREYLVTSSASIWVETGDEVKAGQQLTDGSVNPHDILRILGKDAVQQYLVDEVQKIYGSQGVTINDKHIEVIVHQMLTKVRIDSAGDTDLVPDELVDKYTYEDTNAKVLAAGGEPATAPTVLLGITRASLSTDSWLAAASFQETTRILTEAAANGKVDHLVGLKENVIIGKLIPASYLSEQEVEELEKAAREDTEAMRLLASLSMTDGLPAEGDLPFGFGSDINEDGETLGGDYGDKEKRLLSTDHDATHTAEVDLADK